MRGKHANASAKRHAESMTDALKVLNEQYADLKAKAKRWEAEAADRNAAVAEVARLRRLIEEGTSDALIKEQDRHQAEVAELVSDIKTILHAVTDSKIKLTRAEWEPFWGVVRRHGLASEMRHIVTRMQRRNVNDPRAMAAFGRGEIQQRR